jgi:hypothetical protein
MAGWTAAATSAGTTTPIRTPTVATTGGTIKRSKQVTFLSIDYPHAIAISPPEHPGVQFFFFVYVCIFYLQGHYIQLEVPTLLYFSLSYRSFSLPAWMIVTLHRHIICINRLINYSR